MLKFISENKIKSFLESRNFLLFSCAAIFLLSIFLRSIIDIGADTGVYIDLGKKVAQGKKYYYDFFESNFPFSFYLYAGEYQLSRLLNISPIIVSEIVINLLALASIFYSAQILKKTTIYDNKAHYNLIIIAYFLGFFLRPHALQIGEFGTKTSLLLITLFPYISYSFERKIALTKKNLISRGILMGIMPCIKPHYLILVIFIELHRFLQKKKFSFFCELDKLVMYLLGVLYLFLMIKLTPEFLEFIVPMYQKNYSAYDNYEIFIKNIWVHLAARVLPFSFIFLIFSRLKITENNKVLFLLYIAASTMVIVENICTVDQIVNFYAVTTICFLKITYDIFSSKKIILSENKFLIAALIFVPAFDIEILPVAVFGLSGFVNAWWLFALVYPFLLFIKYNKEERKKYFSLRNILIFITLYLLALIAVVFALRNFSLWFCVMINLTILFSALFFFEKKIYSKVSSTLSPFSVFIIAASISSLFYVYIQGPLGIIGHRGNYTFPNKMSDMIFYYSKIYAPKTEDKIAVSSIWIAHQFPMMNYLKKDNQQKLLVMAMQADRGVLRSNLMFNIKDLNQVFTNYYIFEDVLKNVENPNVKLLFFNNAPEVTNRGNRCIINNLEYYFLNPKFKKDFFKNFRFENRVRITEKVKPIKKIGFITGEEPSVFDQVKPTEEMPIYDFEVYVRR